MWPVTLLCLTVVLSFQIIAFRTDAQEAKVSRPPKTYTCDGVFNKRATCPSGLPAQAVTRWLRKSGECNAYVYPYCRDLEEGAIVHREECQENCK